MLPGRNEFYPADLIVAPTQNLTKRIRLSSESETEGLMEEEEEEELKEEAEKKVPRRAAAKLVC